MRLLLRFCASCAFLRPSLLVLFAAFAGHLAAQPAPVLADPTTGALYRPGAATFASYNNLLTLDGAAGSYLLISTAASTYLPITVAANYYQPLDADLTSWAAVVRAGGFDTFVATPSSANLATLVTGETGSGALVFGTSPTFTTPTLGAATATSITGATDLTLAGGSTGASLVLGQGTTASTLTSTGINQWLALSNTAASNGYVFRTTRQGATLGVYHTASAVSLGTVSNHPLDFFTFDGSTQARLTSTGNLLIGTTTDAASLAGGLVVNGSGAGATSSSTSTGALRVTGGVGVSGAGFFGGSINAVGGQVTGTFTVGNGTANATNAINRGTTAQGNYVQWQTAGALNWAAGSGATGTNTNWELYNYGIGANALSISNTTSAAAFAGAVSIAGTVIHTLSATPASASAAGTVGTMSWDANYIYICTATNTWKRVAIATW